MTFAKLPYRRTIGLAAWIAGSLVVGVWLCSLRWAAFGYSDSFHYRIAAGRVELHPWWGGKRWDLLLDVEDNREPHHWWPLDLHTDRTVYDYTITVPLWIPVAALLFPALVLLWPDLLRFLPGHCRRCGYNLAGLAVPVCPECGTRPKP